MFAIVWKIIILVGLAMILSCADNYLGKNKYIPIQPTELSVLLLLLYSCQTILLDLSKKPRFTVIATTIKNNAFVILPFLLIVAASFLGAMYEGAYWDEGPKWIYLNAYNFVIFCLAMLLPQIPFIRNNMRLIIRCALAALLYAMFYDLFIPGTFSVEINRTAGFPGNSNWGALTAVMLCIGSLEMNPRGKLTIETIVLMLAGFGIFSTLSRSGMLNYLAITLLYIYFTFFTANGDTKKGIQFLAYGLAGVIIAGFIIPLMLSETEIFSESKSQNRLLGFLEGKIVDDGSSEGRLGAATHAIELIEEAPFLGHGTGFSRTMPEKPHNLFLSQWVNNGLPGLLSYLMLLGGAFYHFHRNHYDHGKLLVFATFIGSFFSHNILEQRTFLLLLGMMTTISWLRPNFSQMYSSYEEYR